VVDRARLLTDRVRGKRARAVRALVPNSATIFGHRRLLAMIASARLRLLRPVRPAVASLGSSTRQWPASLVTESVAHTTSAGGPNSATIASEPQRTRRTPDDVVAELVADHLPAMYRVARVLVRDQALAEDVVQDSLLKAWQAASSFRGESSLRSWATRITHNTAISVLRKRREELRDPGTLPEAADQIGAEREVQGRLMVEELWQALDQLDPLTRSIVVLREIEGMAYEDIGEALGIALPTVKTRLFRARRTLAAQLQGVPV
jgi:RNA polymerase sigma-70 factor, ECF subfamily